jgi:hypothetical protein
MGARVRRFGYSVNCTRFSQDRRWKQEIQKNAPFSERLNDATCFWGAG